MKIQIFQKLGRSYFTRIGVDLDETKRTPIIIVVVFSTLTLTEIRVVYYSFIS